MDSAALKFCWKAKRLALLILVCIPQTSTTEEVSIFIFFLKRAVFTRDTNTITTKLTNFPFPLNYYSNAVAGLFLTCTNTHTNTGSEVSLHMVSGLRTARRFAKFTSGCLSPCGQSLLVSPQWGINLTYNHPPVLPTHLNTLWSLSTVS